MALSFSVQCLPSVRALSQVRLSVTDMSDPVDAVVTQGIAATRPATFADLTTPTSQTIIFASTYSIAKAAGLATVSAVYDMTSVPTVGQNVWFMLFHAQPAGAMVPDAIAGPYVVGP